MRELRQTLWITLIFSYHASTVLGQIGETQAGVDRRWSSGTFFPREGFDIRLVIALGREEVGEQRGNDDKDQADDYAGAIDRGQVSKWAVSIWYTKSSFERRTYPFAMLEIDYLEDDLRAERQRR